MTSPVLPAGVSLNRPPSLVDVYLVDNSATTLAAPNVPSRTRLEFEVGGWVPRLPVMDSGVATWRLSPDDVRSLRETKRVRLVVDEQIIGAGSVHHVSEWPRWIHGGVQQVAYLAGAPGKPGIGLDDIAQPEPGRLVFRLSSGSEKEIRLPPGGSGGGAPGKDGVGIADITQPEPNKIEVRLTEGAPKQFSLPRGPRGADGARGQDGAPGRPGADGQPGVPGVSVTGVDQPTPTTMRLQLSTGAYTQPVTLPTAPGGGGPALTEEAIAKAQGYYLDVGEQQPTEATKYGVPVIWVPRRAFNATIPVVAAAPSADPTRRQITIPQVTGVEYVISGQVVPPGVWTAQQDGPVTVTVRALPGYTLTGTASWTFTLGAAPAPGGLIGGDDFTNLESGILLVPTDSPKTGNLITGRQLPNEGNRRLNWLKWATTDSGLAGDGSGGVISPVGTSFADVDLGQEDYTIEIEIGSVPTAHGASITVKPGVGSARQGGLDIAWFCRVNKYEILGTEMKGLDPAAILGTWRIRKQGGTLTVSSPTQENVVTREGVPDSKWGAITRLQIAKAATGDSPVVSSIRWTA